MNHRQLEKQFTAAVIADNWLEVNRLGRKNGMESGELFEWAEFGVCQAYAMGQEPARSTRYKAFLAVLEALQSELYADAITERAKAGY